METAKILVLIAALIGCTQAYSYLVPANYRHYGICYYNGQYLQRGENYLPGKCQRMTCNEDGSIMVEGCGHIDTADCRMIDPLNLYKPYPDCCKLNYKCSQNDIERNVNYLGGELNTDYQEGGRFVRHAKYPIGERYGKDYLGGERIKDTLNYERYGKDYQGGERIKDYLNTQRYGKDYQGGERNKDYWNIERYGNKDNQGVYGNRDYLNMNRYGYGKDYQNVERTGYMQNLERNKDIERTGNQDYLNLERNGNMQNELETGLITETEGEQRSLNYLNYPYLMGRNNYYQDYLPMRQMYNQRRPYYYGMYRRGMYV